MVGFAPTTPLRALWLFEGYKFIGFLLSLKNGSGENLIEKLITQ